MKQVIRSSDHTGLSVKKKERKKDYGWNWLTKIQCMIENFLIRNVVSRWTIEKMLFATLILLENVRTKD